jgi:hypothetical protein
LTDKTPETLIHCRLGVAEQNPTKALVSLSFAPLHPTYEKRFVSQLGGSTVTTQSALCAG